MLPPFPTVPVPTLLRIPLSKPFFFPAISTAPVTKTLTLPASPFPAGWVSDAPRVKVARLAPSVSDRVAALMSILPPLPTPAATLPMPLVSAKEIAFFARTVTFPAFPCP